MTNTSNEGGGSSALGLVREHGVTIVLAVIVIAFIVQNRTDAVITLFWGEVTWPLWLALTVVTLIGVGIGLLIGRRRARAAR